MDKPKSLDPLVRILSAMLCDVQTSHGNVLSPRACRLTIQKIVDRHAREGQGFLTKTLPRLGKALDRALSGEVALDATKLAFKCMPDSKLPKLFGELFERVFSRDGWILPIPCVRSIMALRNLLFVYYKYELPYAKTDEQKVVDGFIATDAQLFAWNTYFDSIRSWWSLSVSEGMGHTDPFRRDIVRAARKLLSQAFSGFDVSDIHPRHGPGAVSTRETGPDKYCFSCVSQRIRQSYALDAYFYASLGHVCDSAKELQNLSDRENPARVYLVPKDSRGPRLISCEPLEFQWVQQGLGRAIMRHVETHDITCHNIHFTDQQPNQFGALLGSSTGRYATLDLNEASDRVSIGLVKLLFPEHISCALLNCRSLSTTLPNGQELKLNKFAPMGSALCFPVLSLTVWALLTAGTEDADTREGILVYGDDVVVPTAYAENAMKILESFGLKINRDKSFTKGLFRESCGVDSFNGVDVTPVRIRTVWASSQRSDVYTSWIAYANAMWKRKFYQAYDVIVGMLTDVYPFIPEISMLTSDEDDDIMIPALVEVPEEHRPTRVRVNSGLQKLERYILCVKTPRQVFKASGWETLLRYFSERTDQNPLMPWLESSQMRRTVWQENPAPLLPLSRYTKRDTSYLVYRWR